MGGIVPHHWSQWEEWCPHHWYQGSNSATSLVSVGGIVPHHWCQSSHKYQIFKDFIEVYHDLKKVMNCSSMGYNGEII
ncbi:unnamed protein product, partial [Staurois parvus]